VILIIDLGFIHDRQGGALCKVKSPEKISLIDYVNQAFSCDTGRIITLSQEGALCKHKA
jgi:hypothetical protein